MNKNEKYVVTNSLTDEQVEKEFDGLLARLPNRGKFYKYRSFYGKKFDNAYDALLNGYLWFASPADMNDKIDTTLNINLKSEANHIEHVFLRHKEKYFTLLLHKFCVERGIKCTFTQDTIKQMFSCCTNTGRLNKARVKILLLQNGTPYNKIQSQINLLESIIDTQMVEYEEKAKDMTQAFISLNERLRYSTSIYCMAERFDIDSMWAYYGNDNKGFCVEYDFNNVKLTTNQKRCLLNTNKIKYTNKRPSFSFAPYIEKMLEDCDIDKFDSYPLLQQIFEQYLIKNTSWKHEREWRIIAEEKVNQFDVDVVSALYIDEDMISTKKGKKLLNLAHKRKWTVYSRRLNVSGNAFTYIKLF